MSMNQPEAQPQQLQQPSPAANPSGQAQPSPAANPSSAANPSIPQPPKVTKLSRAEFEKRVSDASSAKLKKLFGTDDPKAIAQIKKDYDGFKRKSDEERFASLTAQEKLAEEQQKAAQDRKRLEQQLNHERQQRAADRQEQEIKAVFAGKVEKRYEGHVMRDMAQHFMKTKTKKQLSQMTNSDISKWLDGYLAKNPAFKASKNATPVRSGSPNRGKPPTKVAATIKTPKLGHPNSMTEKEWQEYKKQNGFDF